MYFCSAVAPRLERLALVLSQCSCCSIPMHGSSSREISRRLGLLSWIRSFGALVLWQCGTCGTLAQSSPSKPSDFGPLVLQPESQPFLQRSGDAWRRLSVLEFNNADEEFELEESQEEVIRCEMNLISDFPLGLIGEAAILLQKAIRLVLTLREYAVQLLPGSSSSPSTDGLNLQSFRFYFAVLPPKGGSQDVSYMLRKASESAILVKFKELIVTSQAMKDQVGSSTNIDQTSGV